VVLELEVVPAVEVHVEVDHYSVYHFHYRIKQTRWVPSDPLYVVLGIQQVRILVNLNPVGLGVEADDVQVEVGGHVEHSEGVDIRLGGNIADTIVCLGSDIPRAKHDG
jgi:hypothetical protein